MELLKVKSGIPAKMNSGDNPTFEEWMKRVDMIIIRACGLSVNDLPDCRFYDWYQQRVRPVHAANRALRYANNN
jgi:hypothetical protein